MTVQASLCQTWLQTHCLFSHEKACVRNLQTYIDIRAGDIGCQGFRSMFSDGQLGVEQKLEHHRLDLSTDEFWDTLCRIRLKMKKFLFELRVNVPANSFSVMSGWIHRFLDLNQYFVPCSRTQYSAAGGD